MKFKRIGIVYHPLNQSALDIAKQIARELTSVASDHWLCSAWDGPKLKDKIAGTELIITTGGDGTILRAAQAALPLDIPITSVNLGKLGFMTELAADQALEMLPRLIAGDGWDDWRTVLEADYIPHDGRQSQTQNFFAVNDVVVARGGIARIISVDCHIDKVHYATYNGDGVIVASATGSTGYNFAAGGPVMHPQSPDMLLTPILPHLEQSYTLVVPGDKPVSLNVSTNHQATLCIDGHINIDAATGDVIQVRTSHHRLRFLRLSDPDSFYIKTAHKLKGNRN
jgi:NAD+ kinase